MKLGQLTEYNMNSIFLIRFYLQYDGETIPRSVSRKAKLSRSLDQ